MTLFGTSAKFIDAVAKAGLVARRHAPARERADDDVHRIAAGAGELRLRLRARQEGHPPRVDLGRHRHRQLLRRRQSRSARSGAAKSRRARWACSVEVFDEHGQSGRRARRGSSSARCRSRRCRWASGTTRTAASITRRISSKFPGVWCHGDYVELTGHGGIIIYGRSDAVLNPGRRAHRHGRDLPPGRAARRDRREPGRSGSSGTRRADRPVRPAARRPDTDPDARESHPEQIRGATPRRVTCRRASCRCTEIPRTKSGKIVELAVRDVVHGREVRNREALANPEALEQFRDRVELSR